MKEEIIEYLKEHTNADGIDVSLGLKIPISEIYSILGELEKEGRIKREYYGVQTRYTVFN